MLLGGKPERCQTPSASSFMAADCRTRRLVVPSDTRAMLDSSVTAVWLLIGLALGAGASGLLLRARLRALSAQAARASGLEQELLGVHKDPEHERSLAEERLATVHDAQERLSSSFK